MDKALISRCFFQMPVLLALLHSLSSTQKDNKFMKGKQQWKLPCLRLKW